MTWVGGQWLLTRGVGEGGRGSGGGGGRSDR